MVEHIGSDLPNSSSVQKNMVSTTRDGIMQDFFDSHSKMQNELLQQIQTDIPFSEREPYIDYATIKSITPIGFHQSRTGEVFKIETQEGKQYKLRKCRTWNNNHTGPIKAQGVDDTIKGLLDIVPTYYGRQNEYVLFDRLEGLQDFGEAPVDDKYEKLGEVLAKVHANQTNFINNEQANRRITKRTNFESIQEDFTPHQFARIQEKISTGLANPQIKIGLDLWDLTTANLKFTKEGKLLLIDEESVGFTIKGIGLGKALRYKDIDIEKIKLGYESVLDSTYIFEKKFLDFAYLLMLLNSMKIKKMDNNDTSEIKNKIIRLL